MHARMSSTVAVWRRASTGFTLVELLVVVAIIALLLGVLLPALAQARDVARTTKCLANMRNMEVAHWMYMSEHDGRFVQVGLGHQGTHEKLEIAWINTLEDYYGSALLARSPMDNSPYWPPDQGGSGAYPEGSNRYRLTSYGINNFLDADIVPYGGPYHLNNVSRPAATVHFLIMAFEGPYAAADHPHVEMWAINAPAAAASQVQTNAHGGPPSSWESRGNWGFLDGHAETLKFSEVFTDLTRNRFDPKTAY
jgi:prepilin-type N-terminal cleavage/methylation domain-containing protein/prepilin-type processing-associated H-X9-DG protein